MIESRTHLMNAALAISGASRLIISEDDDSKEAKMCSLFYPIARDEALRAFPWAFAVRTQGLAVIEDGNDSEYEYAYRLPTDPYCLRALGLLSEYTLGPWRQEGRAIYTDTEGAILRYIARIEDETVFDSLFSSALIYRLGAYLAVNFSKDQGKAAGLMAMYERELARAQGVSALDGSGGPDSTDYWIDGV